MNSSLSITETLFFLTACKTYWILKYGNGESNSILSNLATLRLMLNVLKSRQTQSEMLKIMTKYRKYKLQPKIGYSQNAI